MKSINRLLASTAMALILSGCVLGNDNRPVVSNTLEGSGFAAEFAAAQGDRLGDVYIQGGLDALESGELEDAQKAFNSALKLDPKSASLHFLNGLTYHMRANAGDTSQLEFAKVGYQLALRYDSGNHWAAFQLGHINFAEQRFREAQDAFAFALSYRPNDVGLWKALAAASYYAQDLDTAERAISQAEKLAPNDPYVMRNTSLINGAMGRFDKAVEYLEDYRNSADTYLDIRSQRLSSRLVDWERYHQKATYQLAQTTSDILGSDDTSSGLSADKDTKSSKKDKDKDKPIATRMTLVDIVIIRSEERRATTKGINLLNGLSATLGGTTLTFGDSTVRGTTNTDTETFTWAQTLAISATYSLNIFNDNADHNEVLARPTLIGLDGKTSDFFSGGVVHVEVSGAAGSQGSIQQIPVGIRMKVKPKFIDDDTVELEVEAARAFIEDNSSQHSFNSAMSVSKTKVTANATMNFGDTIIISGLSEKESENTRDGVPILQDIPGLQYLFSQENTLDFTKSVLVLLSPREPRFTYGDGTEVVDDENAADADVNQPNLDELKQRVDWFKPADNMDAVFHHLEGTDVFREFRAGDVTLETWDTEVGLGDRIRNAIDFIYY